MPQNSTHLNVCAFSTGSPSCWHRSPRTWPNSAPGKREGDSLRHSKQARERKTERDCKGNTFTVLLLFSITALSCFKSQEPKVFGGLIWITWVLVARLSPPWMSNKCYIFLFQFTHQIPRFEIVPLEKLWTGRTNDTGRDWGMFGWGLRLEEIYPSF